MKDSIELFNLTLTPQKYNNDPVTYCKHCLSLGIKIMEDTDYCKDCGSTEMAVTHIDVWTLLYENRYGDGKVIKK